MALYFQRMFRPPGGIVWEKLMLVVTLSRDRGGGCGDGQGRDILGCNSVVVTVAVTKALNGPIHL